MSLSCLRAFALSAACVFSTNSIAAPLTCEAHFGNPTDADYIIRLVPKDALATCRSEYEAMTSDPNRSFRYGYVLLETGDPDGRGLSMLKGAADAGHGPAQSAMGYFAFTGKHVAKSEADSFAWFSRAARSGHPNAPASLAWFYMNGSVVDRDYAKAMTLARPAADAGRPSAQSLVGHLHLNGFGVPKDVRKGYEYIARAAVGGDVWAQTELGVLLENGTATPPDKGLALTWYRRAAEKGDAFAASRVKVLEDEASNQEGGITGTHVAIGAAALALLLLMASGSDTQAETNSSTDSDNDLWKAPESPWKDSCWMMTDMEAALAGC